LSAVNRVVDEVVGSHHFVKPANDQLTCRGGRREVEL